MSDRAPAPAGEFRKILVAAFVSQMGSHLLTLALSAYVLVTTGDTVHAATVFVLSYLPAALVGRWAGRFIERHASRGFLMANDAAAAGLSVLCAAAVADGTPPFVLAGLLAVRSILSLLQRSTMTRWLKAISPPDVAARRFQDLLLGFFFSTAASGLIAAVALQRLGIWGVVAIDVVTYLVGIAVISTFAPMPADDRSQAAAATPAVGFTGRLAADRSLRVAFATLCLSQAFFQGAYSILVTFLPIRKFELGSYGTGYFQMAASLGIIAGYVVIRLRPDRFYRGSVARRAMLALPMAAAALAGVAAALSPSLPGALAAFFALNCCYEIAWLASSSHTFRVVPTAETAGFQFVQGSVAAVAMSLASLALAAAIQAFGLPAAAAGAMAIALAGWAICVTLPQIAGGNA